MSSSPPGEETATVFRRAERYWKSKTCPPDPSHAFCPESVTSWPSDGHSRWKAWTVRRLPLSAPYPCPECLYERQQAFAYAFIDQPGVLFLPAFFCRHAQAFLAKECFEEATGPSHRTNLDAPYRRDRGRGAEGLYGLWERWRRRRPGEDEEEFVLGARAEGGEDLHIAEVWEKGKMRWSVLGWQYDWSTKQYDWLAPPSPLPTVLVSLCRAAVASLSHELCEERDRYVPDAAIVNFYQVCHPLVVSSSMVDGVLTLSAQTRHTLTAHQDEAEESSTAPLVSLSLGHSATFLVSPSKSLNPLALMLRSGDVVIMSGEKGRRSWHGVPKVFSGPEHRPRWLDAGDEEETEGEGWREWLREGGRVNANVRQVFDTVQMQTDAR